MTDKEFRCIYQESIRKVFRNSQSIGVSFPQVASVETGMYNRELPSYWTAGFWGGLVWLAYRELKKESLMDLGWAIEEAMDRPLDDFQEMHHDVGFMWLPTAVFHHNLTGCETSKIRGLKAASLLASRFNLNGRFIRAWNEEQREKSSGYVIIDCLMNLPLLYWASKTTGDPRFKQIACAHTDTVLKNFVRANDSVPHIMNFNSETGELIGTVKGQGKSLDSIWSRGQAWGIYGFAIGYRETGKKEYLDTACRMARAFFEHLPEDKVPYWDFCSEQEDQYARDSSAACIAASGMLEISRLSRKEEDKQYYKQCAEEILSHIISRYLCLDEKSQGLVTMGTVNYACRRYINQPIIYGDFYFVEALAKLKGMSGVF